MFRTTRRVRRPVARRDLGDQTCGCHTTPLRNETPWPSSRPHPETLESHRLLDAQADVCVLKRLARRPLAEVVDRARCDQVAGLCVDARRYVRAVASRY